MYQYICIVSINDSPILIGKFDLSVEAARNFYKWNQEFFSHQRVRMQRQHQGRLVQLAAMVV